MFSIHENTRLPLPGPIEAALQFLRFIEEVRRPQTFDGTPGAGRELSRTEAEVLDSALTTLLEYFNLPLATPVPMSESGNDIPV